MRVAAMKKSQDDFNNAVKTLKEEWKAEYDTKLKKAEETVGTVFDDDFKAYLKSSGLGNHPKFVKAMFDLSEKVSEDTLTRTKTGPSDEVERDPITGQRMLKYPKSPELMKK
jgi:hypothetical protein